MTGTPTPRYFWFAPYKADKVHAAWTHSMNALCNLMEYDGRTDEMFFEDGLPSYKTKCGHCKKKLAALSDTERGKTSKEPRANRKPGHPWDEPLSDTERGKG